MEAAIEAGADDVASDDDGAIEVVCEPQAFDRVKAAFERAGLKPEVADVVMKPLNEIEVSGDDGNRMQKLLDAIEELDDVQQVYTNAIVVEA
jgi:transcriptional/translational regulatory protein YebC/TACO1